MSTAGPLVPSRTEDVQPTPPRQRRPGSVLAGLVRTARPRQWVKNVLVAAAPVAAGVLTQPFVALRTALAFVALSLAASGTYFLNDARDAGADRLHPVKRHRPIAAGIVPVRLAEVVGVGLLLLAVGVCVAAGNLGLAGVVLAYEVLTVSYTLVLKHQAVLDLAAVASGFVLRAVAGAVAVDVPISQWFLIVASFGSLFMVAGKRYAEFELMGEDRKTTRSSLALYSSSFLRYVWGISSAIAITGYCLWAFEVGAGKGGVPWSKISILPFVVGILRYALDVDRGQAGAPEDVVLGDRQLQVTGLCWLVVFAAGVYLG